MLEASIQALQNFTSLDFWSFMLAGIVVGLIFGIIPGIGASQALALFLPFVFFLKPMQAFPFMMGVMSATHSGGTITTVLLGVPGVPGDAATMMDGYPMSKKGEGGRALGAALWSSFIANLIIVFVALALVPVILPLALALHHSDMVIVILLGLTFIAALSTGSMAKGLLSGLMGLLVALIGFQPVTGAARFTFDTTYLYDGIPLIPVTLGLFALPEMIMLATRGGAMAHAQVAIGGMRQVWQGTVDVFRHKMLVVRGLLIAFVAGITPGVGGSIAGFVSYAHAKQVSKSPEKFGTGTVEGVIAPQTATSGEAGAALLTTLAIGIPGNPAQALLLAAFIMLGLVPGPEMMTKNLSISLTLLYVLLAGGLIATVVCLPLAPRMAKIALVPGRILVPLMAVVIFVGTFVYRERFEDMIVLVFCTILGLALKRYGYSVPSMFLGFILGDIFENYLFVSLQLGGPLFFTKRPIAMILIFLMVLYFSWGPIKRRMRRGQAPE